MKTIGEQLVKACAMHDQVEQKGKSFDPDFGDFGSLCERQQRMNDRFSRCLSDFISESHQLLLDAHRKPVTKESQDTEEPERECVPSDFDYERSVCTNCNGSNCQPHHN